MGSDFVMALTVTSPWHESVTEQQPFKLGTGSKWPRCLEFCLYPAWFRPDGSSGECALEFTQNVCDLSRIILPF